MVKGKGHAHVLLKGIWIATNFLEYRNAVSTSKDKTTVCKSVYKRVCIEVIFVVAKNENNLNVY